MKHLPRLAARVFNCPLAIAPDKAAVIAAVLSAKINGDNLAASSDSGGEDGELELEISEEGIAQINVCGTLVEKSSWLDAASGLLSYESLTSLLNLAASDARVKGVLMVFDSPGGEVTGMFEAANAMASFPKPILASINYCGCSAAYLLASQADSIWVTESSVTGSIGVIAQHMETSRWDAAVGIKYTTIFAGARKNDGNPHEPLSEGAQAAIQNDVNAVMDRFVAYVAKGRGVDEESIRATQAAIYRGEAAIEMGLADQFGTPSDAMVALMQQIPKTSSVAAATRKKEVLRMSSTIQADPTLAATTTTEAPAEVAKTETKKPESKEPQVDLEEDPPAPVLPKQEDEMLSGQACQEIATLCSIAGRASLAAQFITQQVPVANVREKLAALAADNSPEIRSSIDPSIGANPAPINLNDPKQNPLLADAQRRAAAAQPKGAR